MKYNRKFLKKETKKRKQVQKTEEQIRKEWIMARRAIIMKHQHPPK